VFLKGGNR